MSLHLSGVTIDVDTTAGPLKYSTRFGPGLNILSAPNSFGKSTLLQSIAYALGLEGMFSASRRAPVGPVLTTVSDFPDGSRGNVLQSSVTLDIENDRGELMRTQRFLVGNVETSLVRTWRAVSLEDLDSARQVDMFVRLPGAASRELGFHTELAAFLGWTLPVVPAFGGGEVSLYLEAIFPLFFVEQKSGWSGITPRLPTYLRIRDVLQRSVEFTLGLDALQRRRELAALKENESDIRRRWVQEVTRITSAATAEGFGFDTIDSSPVEPERRNPTLMFAEVNGHSVVLPNVIDDWDSRLIQLEAVTQVESAANRTVLSREELRDAEQTLRGMMARSHLTTERLQLLMADLDSLAARLAAVEADRQRALDLKRLRGLGSNLDTPLVAEDRCPTCSQLLDDRHAATGHVVTLDDTLLRLDAERTTLRSMRTAAEGRQVELEQSQVVLARNLSDSRQRVRLLRDELVGPGNAPSLVDLQERLRLRERLESARRVEAVAQVMDESLDRLAEELKDTRRRTMALEGQPQSDADRETVAHFQRAFTEQLANYGLRSLPPGEVTIDQDTFVPVNDGLELAFDLTLGISASDTIRTKWAYFVSLAEAALSSARGHHPGLLVLDEPRQQETDKVSVAALVRRLSRMASEGGQIIFATSEDPDDLDTFLAGLPYSQLNSNGSRLLM